MIFILFIIACSRTPEQVEEDKESTRVTLKCSSRSSGSQPECWDDQDWEAFCQRVTCKRQ